METILKCSAAAIFGALICLLIKKQNAELSLALSILITVSVMLSFSDTFAAVSELFRRVQSLLGNSSALIKPIMKCMCIGIISKFASDICKDASQAALAAALEFGGSLCAAAIAVPLIINTLEMISTMV